MCRIKATICSSIKCYASVCRYHENFMLLLDELHKVNKTIPTYLKEFTQSLVCNPERKLCWKNLCKKCKDSSLLDHIMYLAILFYRSLVGKIQLCQMERKNFESYHVKDHLMMLFLK